MIKFGRLTKSVFWYVKLNSLDQEKLVLLVTKKIQPKQKVAKKLLIKN